MKIALHLYICPLLLAVLTGCASQKPPVIALDEPVEHSVYLNHQTRSRWWGSTALPEQLKPLTTRLPASRARNQSMNVCG